MEELIRKLSAMPNSYFGFVAGIVSYAKKKPERMAAVMKFLEESKDLTTSDVVEFVMMQPDFHEDGLGKKEEQAV